MTLTPYIHFQGNAEEAMNFYAKALGGKIDETFKKMADGETVTMPLQNQFLGARFGMLKDKFGVAWMFNSELKK